MPKDGVFYGNKTIVLFFVILRNVGNKSHEIIPTLGNEPMDTGVGHNFFLLHLLIQRVYLGWFDIFLFFIFLIYAFFIFYLFFYYFTYFKLFHM